MKEPVGLIGIGLVGSALAEGLLRRGYPVVGYDLQASQRVALEQLGGEAAACSAQVGQRVERLLLSLMDTDGVLAVVEGEILPGKPKVTTIIDTTTGDPERTRLLAERLHGRGIALLDATISGSSEQIRCREGVFMVGGRLEAYEQCRDIFSTLAEHSVYVGPSGCGSRAKLATNLVLGLNRLVLAEGLVFAEKLGLQLPGFLDLLKLTPAYSRAMDVKGRKMLEEEFTPQSRIIQHEKDLRIILEMAREVGQELPLAALHRSLLLQAMAAGDGELDNSAVIRQLRRMGNP